MGSTAIATLSISSCSTRAPQNTAVINIDTSSLFPGLYLLEDIKAYNTDKFLIITSLADSAIKVNIFTDSIRQYPWRMPVYSHVAVLAKKIPKDVSDQLDNYNFAASSMISNAQNYSPQERAGYLRMFDTIKQTTEHKTWKQFYGRTKCHQNCSDPITVITTSIAFFDTSSFTINPNTSIGIPIYYFNERLINEIAKGNPSNLVKIRCTPECSTTYSNTSAQLRLDKINKQKSVAASKPISCSSKDGLLDEILMNDDEYLALPEEQQEEYEESVKEEIAAMPCESYPGEQADIDREARQEEINSAIRLNTGR